MVFSLAALLACVTCLAPTTESWSLPAPAAPPGPARQAQTSHLGQVIRGVVLEAGTERPLPGANVILLDSEPFLGASTDTDGRFVLEGVPLGRHTIQASFIGFQPRDVTGVLVTAGKEVVLRIVLEERVFQGAEVVVTPNARIIRQDLAPVSARAFSVEETRRYAGGLDDPGRMASVLPGVATGVGVQDNAMVIRGNAPKGVQWRLEGVEIPNPNHFAGLSVAGGGGLTLFSAQLLDDSELYLGAFPASYGNAMAGVFDMRFRSGNRARREHTVQAGLLGLEVASEGPFRRAGAATYLFNYRYSTLGLLLPLLPTEDVATYQDLSFKLAFPTARAGRFEVWGIGGLDRQKAGPEYDPDAWEYETWDRLDTRLRLGVGALGVSHRLVLGARSWLYWTAAATGNRTALRQNRLDDDLVLRPDLEFSTRDRRVVLRAEANRAGRRHAGQIGGSIQFLSYDLGILGRVHPGQPFDALSRGAGTTSLVQAHIQDRAQLAPALDLTLGLHLQHFGISGQTVLEPRAGLSWRYTDRAALNLGYGRHSQIEDLRIYAVIAGDGSRPNRSLEMARAHHLVVGNDWLLLPGLTLGLEAYYQHLSDVPVIADSSWSMLNFEQDLFFGEALTSAGAGKNYGVEVSIERPLNRGYYFLANASAFESRYRCGDGVWRSTRFDRGYAGNALLGREWAVQGQNLIGANIRLVASGGKRFSPVVAEQSKQRHEVVFDESRAFDAQWPGLWMADLTLTYQRNHDGWSGAWALQIKNVLAAQDRSFDYNFSTSMVETVREGFPLPVLSYKVDF